MLPFRRFHLKETNPHPWMLRTISHRFHLYVYAINHLLFPCMILRTIFGGRPEADVTILTVLPIKKIYILRISLVPIWCQLITSRLMLPFWRFHVRYISHTAVPHIYNLLPPSPYNQQNAVRRNNLNTTSRHTYFISFYVLSVCLECGQQQHRRTVSRTSPFSVDYYGTCQTPV